MDPLPASPAVKFVLRELKEVKKYENLETHFCEDIQMAYITGSKDDEGSRVFLPIPTTQNVNLHTIQILQRKLNEKIVVVLCSPSLTTLYYVFSDGLTKNEVKPNV